MESTWTSVAQMNAPELQRLQALCGEEQDELTTFAMACLTELSPDAAGVGLYVHAVLMEAFRRTHARFLNVSAEKIERAWENNGAFVDALQQAGYARQLFSVQAEQHDEAAALQYVFDALTEDDEEDPVEIDDDDFWHVVRVLKTVIDCMHDAQRTS